MTDRIPGEGRKCTYCKRIMHAWTETHPTRDHVLPKSRGGQVTVLTCYQCNQMKSNALPEDWERFMRENPEWWNRPGVERRLVLPKQPPHECPVMKAVCDAIVESKYPHVMRTSRPDLGAS